MLTHPVDSLDRNKITQIVLHIINQNRNKFIWPKKSIFSKKLIQIPWFPSYISVNLYRLDGPIRWISAGGWLSGNLIAVAEYTKSKELKPLVLENPEAIIGKVRLRYSGDQEAIRKVQEDILNLVDKIQKDAAKNSL